MRIIIFENEANFRKKVCRCIEKTTHHKIDLATDQWSALSQSYGDERTLYFLDIMVKDEPQGIAFAQWLLQQSDRHLIVFITNFMDKILGKTYLQVNAFNVIYKQSPHVMEQIIDTIDLAQAHINSQTLVIENRIENCILPFDDIHWIQAIKQTNKVLIHTEKGNYTYVDSLKNIFSQLDRRFVYANRSDIVNRDKIRRVDKLQKQLILEDGSSCDYTISYALKNNLL